MAYPRLGERIAPTMLAPLLVDLVPGEYAHVDHPAVRLCDLDESVWERFDKQTCAAFADAVVAAVRRGVSGMPSSLGRSHVAVAGAVFSFNDLGLDTRTENCLRKRGIWEHPESLAGYTVNRMLRVRSFGARCLVDLLCALESVEAAEPTVVWESRNRNLSDGHTQSCQDVRVPSEGCVAELPAQTVEQELMRITTTVSHGPLAERNAALMIRHWGWDGQGRVTLESLGEELGCSRQNVHQVVTDLGELISQRQWSTPMLDRAAQVVADMGLATVEKAALRLATEGLTSRPFHPACLLTALTVFGRQAPFTVEHIAGADWVVKDESGPNSPAEIGRAVLDSARCGVKVGGACRIDQLRNQVALATGVDVSEEATVSIVTALTGFEWLDRSQGWFWLGSGRSSYVERRIGKIIAVCGGVSIHQLGQGISRCVRMAHYCLPPHVLKAICSKLPWLTVTGDLVEARGRLRPEDVLEGAELAIARLLLDYGPVLRRDEMEAELVGQSMTREAFYGLTYSVFVKKVRRGVYGLLSATDGTDRAFGSTTLVVSGRCERAA